MVLVMGIGGQVWAADALGAPPSSGLPGEPGALGWSRQVVVDLGTLTASLDGAVWRPGSGGLALSQGTEGITVTVEWTEGWKLTLRGKTTQPVLVRGKAAVQLVLDGVDIRVSRGQALGIATGQTAHVVVAAGTVNTLMDGKDRHPGLDIRAALHTDASLVVSGTGSLVVQGSYRHAVYSAGSLVWNGPRGEITVTARDGLRSLTGFWLESGSLRIRGTGASPDDESKGIKVEGSEKFPGTGQVVIRGGTLDIETVGKAVTAGWDRDDDAKTSTTADDPDPDLWVTGGTIRIVTTGIPYERTGADGTTVSNSPEGLEAKSDLVITGGSMVIRTTDDALNAGDSIVVTGGRIYAEASHNDAIDSNGTIRISGGVVVAVASGREGSIDGDSNLIEISGGVVVGIGANTSPLSGVAGGQGVVITEGYPGGTLLSLADNQGRGLLTWRLPVGGRTLILSAPGLRTGGSYRLLTGGTASGGEEFEGLRWGALNLGGASLSRTLVMSSTVLRDGGQIFGPGGRGGVAPPPRR